MWNKYKKMAVQAKASIWYTICNFFQKGISFVVVPIYVRLLTTAEYGAWSVFQSWSSILIIFASLNLYCGVYTKTLVDIVDKDERNKYTSSMQGLGTITTLIFFIAYIFMHGWVDRIIGLSTEYMLLLFLYFIVYPAFSFWSTRQRVEYHYKLMVLVTVIISILTPTVSIVLLFWTSLRAEALILGYLLIQCFVGTFFYCLHFYKCKCFYNRKYWEYAIGYNIPLIPHYLSLIVLGQSDRIMIKHYCGESDAGIYSFAYQIASAINVLISAVNGSRVPWTYEQLKEKAYYKLNKISTILVIMMAGVVLIISLISPEIIGILGTSDYSTAVFIIPVVTVGVYFTFVYDLYASIEFYYGATKYVMFASVLGAVLNIVLNAIFIPLFGFIAAAYTTLICYVAFMFMHYIFARKVLSDLEIKNDLYDNQKIFVISFVLGVTCLSTMMTYSYLEIRVILVLTIFLLCLIWRKNIFNMLRTIIDRDNKTR